MAVFRVTALTLPEWLCVLGLSLAPVAVCEMEKALRRAVRR